jgi:hypothetical protein
MPRSLVRWGVFQHAWFDNANGVPIESGTGYVVREMTDAVPYSRMTPAAIYQTQAAAQRKADKLNNK